MHIELGGTTVLVTGGSSGIGEEIAKSLASSGAKVALHYNSNGERARDLVEQFNNGSRCFYADFAVPGSASALFAEVIGEMGCVDVLVNNAGIFEPSPVSLPGDKWLKNWNRTIEVNLTSAGALCHAAINHFMERSGGRIINIASRAAFRGETEDYLAYGVSKGGMVSLSRAIARSFGKQNIKSFVIAPGYVWTPMAEKVIDRNKIIDTELALGEMTEPGHIAPVVVFIAAGRLDHGTGTSIDINAGSYMR